MPSVSGLRSPYERVGGLVFFGRSLDKIRLHAAGRLPIDYHANLGRGFDLRLRQFLRLDYTALRERALAGGSDEEILAWAFAAGRRPEPGDLALFNGFMTKRGWRDEASDLLQQRAKELQLAPAPQTFFDLIEADEGRTPPAKVD